MLYLEFISFSCRDHWSFRLNLALKAFVWKHFLIKNSDVVSQKTLKKRKEIGHTLTCSIWGIYDRSKSFFRLDKSEGSNQLMKNDGFLHCRFSLGLLLAWPFTYCKKIPLHYWKIYQLLKLR